MANFSASILSADLAHLGDQVPLVEPYAQVIQIDVMDGRFIPPLTFGPPVVAALRTVTTRTLHGYLQVESPQTLFDDLAEAGPDIVSFHVEAVADPVPSSRRLATTACASASPSARRSASSASSRTQRTWTT